jgi:hypothetical protein
MNKLELLNTWYSVTLRHKNGQRCTIEPMWGCSSFLVSLYYKGKRLPFYGRTLCHAYNALTYAKSLGYK